MTQTATDPRSSQSGWAISTPLDRPIRGIARRVGGEKAREVERFLKFAIVGIIGAIVDFGTLNLLTHSVLPLRDADGNSLSVALPGGLSIPNIAIATTIAFIAAVASNFIWNRIWTYPDARGRSLRRQLGLFVFISLVGWLARTVWINWSYSHFADFIMPMTDMSHEQAAIVGANIAQLIAVAVVMVWNFVANRLWTYNDVQ